MNTAQRTVMCLLFSFSHSVFAQNFLCGNDEDGCIPGRPDTCVCVTSQQKDAYCLDTKTLSCLPPMHKKQCSKGFVDEHTQGRCLAVVWQSEAEPSCKRLDVLPKASLCAASCASLEDCWETVD